MAGEKLNPAASTNPGPDSALGVAASPIERLITQFEEAAQIDDAGVEFWDARDLQGLLGYSKWDSFLDVVEKAREACRASGQTISDHFADVRKMVPIGSGAERERETHKIIKAPRPSAASAGRRPRRRLPA